MHELPRRRHPHRLAREAVSSAGSVVFVTVRARQDARLDDAGVAPGVIAVFREHAERRRIRVLVMCVMPDHVHVLAAADGDGADTAGWIRFAKREAARQAGLRNLWQRSYWDRALRGDEDFWGVARYIDENPVRRGLCAAPEDWPWRWAEEWDPVD